MLDTLFPKLSDNFLMSRFFDPLLKEFAVIDGPTIIFKNLKKTYYGEFYFHCIKHTHGIIKAILTADINVNGKYEKHQYVIWELKENRICAATLLNGNENFEVKL